MSGFNVSSDYASLSNIQIKVRQIRVATLENASKILLAKTPIRLYNHSSGHAGVGTLNMVA